MQRVSSSLHFEMSSGIFEIMFEAIFSFWSSANYPILGDKKSILFCWNVSSWMILISNNSSGSRVSWFLSSLIILIEDMALMWGEMSWILFARRSRLCTLGRFLQNSSSIIWILLLLRLRRIMLSKRFDLKAYLLKILLKLIILSSSITSSFSSSVNGC